MKIKKVIKQVTFPARAAVAIAIVIPTYIAANVSDAVKDAVGIQTKHKPLWGLTEKLESVLIPDIGP